VAKNCRQQKGVEVSLEKGDQSKQGSQGAGSGKAQVGRQTQGPTVECG